MASPTFFFPNHEPIDVILMQTPSILLLLGLRLSLALGLLLTGRVGV